MRARAVAAALLVAFASLSVHASPVQEWQLMPAQCSALAQLAGYAAEGRDQGEDEAEYAGDILEKNSELPGAVLAYIQQEIEMAFRSPLSPEDVWVEVLHRCWLLRGKLGVLV